VSIQWEGVIWSFAAAIWLLLALLPRMAAFRLPPPAGPPTLEPGAEAPAVASLLVSGARARRIAAAATVLDLGARGLLDLAWVGPSILGCRAVRELEGVHLRPFERRVLDRLRLYLRGSEAPVSALLPAARSSDARRWYSRFSQEVIAVARAQGYVSPQLPTDLQRLLLLAAIVPAGLPALFIWRSGGLDVFGAAAAVVAAAGVLLAAWALLPRGVRATEVGREAASRWLGVLAGIEAQPWQGQAPLRDPVPARVLALGADLDLLAAFHPRRMRTFVGRVELRYQRLDDEAVSWYLAVEGGGSLKTRAWVVGHELFDRFPTGSQVRATVDGRSRLLWLEPGP
jgi:hypothetical protein